jgi:hypothetical protein
MVRGTAGWFAFPVAIAITVGVAFIAVGRDLGLIAWPFAAAAMIFGLFAWWLYDADGAERSLLRGMAASLFVAITAYAVTFPSLPALFPSALVDDEIRGTGCMEPQVVSTYAYQEPSLVFMLGTYTRFADTTAAALFLGLGPCRFALIDSRSVGSFVQRANLIGLRYSLTQRIEGYNISIGRQVSFMLFRSIAEP